MFHHLRVGVSSVVLQCGCIINVMLCVSRHLLLEMLLPLHSDVSIIVVKQYFLLDTF